MKNLKPLELFLIQIIIYSILWLSNDYIATFLSLTFTAIFFFILLVSIIAEWIEPSKVPRWYFKFMLVSIIAPLVAGIFFVGIMGLGTEWVNSSL